MDKALALILCRLPIFQRELTKSMPLPSIEDLMSISSRFPTKGLPILFEAHYEQQMALMSRIQVEVWHCLHGQETHNVPEVRKELEVWYTEAKKVRFLWLLRFTWTLTDALSRFSKPALSQKSLFWTPTDLF